MTEEIRGPYRFTVRPRSGELGGWRLRAYETLPNGTELEVHGNVFSASGEDNNTAYEQALAAGHEWLASMPKPEYRDAEHYMLGYVARDATARLGD
ncbi:hypothetical protein MUN82_04950 [Hymenobacter aerilatus]|uniref:Uncharacterized protein n=1 Tax=Hymenobacter aerilatus TaxID=2932251 RepID=A0A8T9SZS6_9BACT|nr:hypothetical protein [Hymenobacter aerilatus]UOR06444.1 hypothetical protein MUN82_04950 [Hymenobacter aerilatus]